MTLKEITKDENVVIDSRNAERTSVEIGWEYRTN